MRVVGFVLIAVIGCRPHPAMPTMPEAALDRPAVATAATALVEKEEVAAVAEEEPAPAVPSFEMPSSGAEPLSALPSRPAIVEVPAIGRRPYFVLPPDAPEGDPLVLPDAAPKRDDRRVVTMIERDYDDDGRPSRTRRIEIAERVGDVRNGHPYATTMTILDARRREHGAETRIISAAEYVRLDEPAMFGDSGTSVTFMTSGGRIVGGEEQALYDFDDEEANVERAMDVLRSTPLRVGESSMPYKMFGLGMSHMAVNMIRREADRGGAARYVMVTDDGDRRAIFTVDPVRGRPLAYHMEWAWQPSTYDVTFAYPD